MTSTNRTLRTFLKIVEGKQPSLLALSFREFLLDRQARNASPGSLTFYRQKLTPFLDYLEAQSITDPDQATAKQVRYFLVALQETGHTAGGQHAYFRAIRAFFNWLEQEGEIESNPMARIKPPKVPEELLEPVRLDHLRAMLESCDMKTELGCRDHAVMLALLDTGARASEMTALNVGDIDLNTGSVVIRQGKGRKPRVTFLGAKSLRMLIKYLRFKPSKSTDAPLWTAKAGSRLTYTGLRDIARRRARDAGVPAPNLHAFRRGFAVLSLRNGADIFSLQRLMGHTSLTVLRRYLKQTEDDLQEAHRRAGPVDNSL